MRRLIPGTPLLGFAGAFEAATGDPSTPQPYPRVTPSRVGPVLLPFPCPHCGRPAPELVDERSRANYTASGVSWCPSCRGRFLLDTRGLPLATTLDPGATVAPARVEGDGRFCSASSLHLLGAGDA